MAIGDRSFLSTPRRVWLLMKRIVRSRSAEARFSRSRMSDRRSGHNSEIKVYFSVFACCNRPMRRRCTKFLRNRDSIPARRTRGSTRHVATTRAREPRDAPQSHRALTGRHSRVSRDGASSAPPRFHRRDFPAAQETVGGGEHFFKGAIAAGVGRRRGTREIAPNPRIRVRLDVHNAPRRTLHRNPRSSPRSPCRPRPTAPPTPSRSGPHPEKASTSAAPERTSPRAPPCCAPGRSSHRPRWGWPPRSGSAPPRAS